MRGRRWVVGKKSSVTRGDSRKNKQIVRGGGTAVEELCRGIQNLYAVPETGNFGTAAAHVDRPTVPAVFPSAN